MPTIMSGQLDRSSANEGVALATNTDIASFTVNNTTDTASAFTAVIDWGDGTTSAGTVVGSNGSFTVDGGHTYADEGFPQATVTITRTADNTQIAPSGTVAVADTDNLTGHGLTFGFTPNQPLTNVTVATFTDTNTINGASDFVATIDWGDGTTTAGTVSGSNGSFSILGSHTYTASGDNTITVFMNDDFPDAAFAFATSTAASGFAGHVVLTTATEGTALTNETVASFADTTANLPASDYTATIDWGDGTTTAGTVAGSNGTFSVQGSHTYADEGNDLLSVTITRTTDSTVVTPTGSIAILEGDLLSPTPKTIGGQPGVLISNAVVATFTDNNTGNVAGDFTATIDWGDGATSAGTVSGSGATFSVSGSHTYAAAGQDTISVTLADQDPGTASATANSTAFIGFAAGDVVLTDATERVALAGNTAVATFTDGNFSDTAGSFTATIDWGDGTTSAGTIVGSNGSFTVDGGHTYADEAAGVPVIATITRTSNNAVVVDTGNVAVAENDALTPHGTTINGSPGQALTNVTVATFTDTDTAAPASDFTATIDWGDGTTTAGTVSGSGGTFSVAGTHTYAADGHDTISVTLTDDAPGTATATATSTANIGLSGQVVLTTATERVALASNTAVATFVDNNLSDTAGSFTSTIDWGDGTTSAGTVSGASGSFTVSGGHTYADEGNFSAIATLVRTSDHETGASTGSVAVAEHDALSAQGSVLTANQGQALSNVTVATFTDTDTAAPANDFTATINWGDGTTSAGTVSGSNGAFNVLGTHTYATAGQDTIQVHVADDAPGTATADATGTASINAVNAAPVNTVPASPLSAAATGSVVITGLGVSDVDANGGTETTTLSVQHGTLNVAAAGGASVIGSGTGSVTVTGTLSAINATLMASGNVAYHATSGFLGVDTLTMSTNDNGHTGNGGPQTDTDLVFINNFDDSRGAPPPLPHGAFTYHSPVDLNGDGMGDILFRQTAGTIDAWLLNGPVKQVDQVVSALGNDWHVAAKDDFNGDGKTDILLRHDNGTVALWTMNGATKAADQIVSALGNDWHIAATDDFNGDGKSDILLRHDNGTVALWTMNGATKTADQVVSALGNDWHIAATDDFNGDGKSDILLRHDNGTIALWTMNGAQKVADQIVSALGNDWHIATTADFNGDGKTDILLRHDNGTVALWTMNGAQKVADQVIGPMDNSWHLLGAGDFNADGHADLLWRNDNGAVEVWEMNGAQKVVEQVVSPMGNDWHFAGLTDVNNDHMTDILWRHDNGDVAVWEMNGAHKVVDQVISHIGNDWVIA